LVILLSCSFDVSSMLNGAPSESGYVLHWDHPLGGASDQVFFCSLPTPPVDTRIVMRIYLDPRGEPAFSPAFCQCSAASFMTNLPLTHVFFSFRQALHSACGECEISVSPTRNRRTLSPSARSVGPPVGWPSFRSSFYRLLSPFDDLFFFDPFFFPPTFLPPLPFPSVDWFFLSIL